MRVARRCWIQAFDEPATEVLINNFRVRAHHREVGLDEVVPVRFYFHVFAYELLVSPVATRMKEAEREHLVSLWNLLNVRMPEFIDAVFEGRVEQEPLAVKRVAHSRVNDGGDQNFAVRIGRVRPLLQRFVRDLSCPCPL